MEGYYRGYKWRYLLIYTTDSLLYFTFVKLNVTDAGTKLLEEKEATIEGIPDVYIYLPPVHSMHVAVT